MLEGIDGSNPGENFEDAIEVLDPGTSVVRVVVEPAVILAEIWRREQLHRHRCNFGHFAAVAPLVDERQLG